MCLFKQLEFVGAWNVLPLFRSTFQELVLVLSCPHQQWLPAMEGSVVFFCAVHQLPWPPCKSNGLSLTTTGLFALVNHLVAFSEAVVCLCMYTGRVVLLELTLVFAVHVTVKTCLVVWHSSVIGFSLAELLLSNALVASNTYTAFVTHSSLPFFASDGCCGLIFSFLLLCRRWFVSLKCGGFVWLELRAIQPFPPLCCACSTHSLLLICHMFFFLFCRH